MKTYRAAVIGCSRIGGFIDNEVVGREGPSMQPPSSHGGGYFVSGRTDLVACSDLREDVMEEFGNRYDVPKGSQYTDYREMIEKEQLDIVSVATQPEHRAKIVIYAAEHGVRAIYAEKALAASLDEADVMVDAIERNGVAFNMGANRRWSLHFDKVKEIVDSGELGPMKAIVIYNTSSLFNSGSHAFDTVLRLNGDQPVEWVQGNLPDDSMVEGDTLLEDPVGEGIIRFANGVTCYALDTGLGGSYQVVCEEGYITIINDGEEFDYQGPGPLDSGGRPTIVAREFPEVKAVSTVVNIVEDLAHALDTGEPTRGGIRTARASLEMSFAIIESHLGGGGRVDLPLGRRNLTLNRARAPRQPRYEV